MSAPDAEAADAAARHLFELHRSRGKLRRLPPPLRAADVDSAYETQARLQELLAAERGAVAGWKIALTTPVMQRLMGVDTPCAGAVFAGTIHASPAILRADGYARVAVECEIAVRLGRDLDGVGHTRASVVDAVEALMPAIEIVDDQNADYNEIDALELIANNAWNAGLVLGPPLTDWRRLDLAAAEGTMAIAGEVVGSGRGGDVLGHPLAALAWLANGLASRGRPLKRGMVVSTGSVVSTRWPKPGDEVVVRVDGLGEAVARFA